MSSLRYRVLFSIRKSCFSTVDPFLSLMSELKKKKKTAALKKGGRKRLLLAGRFSAAAAVVRLRSCIRDLLHTLRSTNSPVTAAAAASAGSNRKPRVPAAAAAGSRCK